MSEAWMAIVISPEGRAWESTAAVVTGFEAEMKARKWAQSKFMHEMLGPFFKTGTDRLSYSFWEVARENGWKCVTSEVEILSTQTDEKARRYANV